MPDPSIDFPKINFKEFLATFWKGKLTIFLTLLLSLFCCSFYLNQSEKKFTTTVIIKPVTTSDDDKSLTGLQNLASITGGKTISKNSSQYGTFKLLLHSEEVSEKILPDQELIKLIFADEWDQGNEKFIEKDKSNLERFSKKILETLIGTNTPSYRAPDVKRLSVFFQTNIKLEDTSDEAFTYISMQNSQPEIAPLVILELIRQTDKILKEKFILTGNLALQFYQNKILTARSIEHREILAKLIAKEEQRLMLATREGPFAAEIVVGPTVSMLPTYPNHRFVLSLGLVLGLTFGWIIIILLESRKKRSIN